MKQNNIWSVKNERRKEMRGDNGSVRRRNYRDGRRNRHVLAQNGAFGSLSGRAYNLCAMGTHSNRIDDDNE